MEVVILGPKEMRIVVRDERQIELLRQSLEQRVDALLLGNVPLQFDVEARLLLRVGTEGLGMPFGLGDGERPVPLVVRPGIVGEMVCERGAEVPVDGHDALVPRLERRLVHPWLAIEAVEKRIGAQSHEIAPARDVQRQKHEVKTTIRHAGRRAIATITRRSISIRRDVGLDPQDGLDARRPGRFVKLEGGVEIPVVRHRDRRHAQVLDPIDECLHPVPAVEEGVFAVKVQVGESVGVWHLGHVHPWG